MKVNVCSVFVVLKNICKLFNHWANMYKKKNLLILANYQCLFTAGVTFHVFMMTFLCRNQLLTDA